jgi:conjugal transfer pilus assembly protein TraW
VAPQDITDHRGQLIHAKGTKINPLETVSLSQDLIFFDGDDEEQVAWVKGKMSIDGPQDSSSSKQYKVILVKGPPLSLSEEWGLPIFFDQGGVLTKKLGITHVPALVSQEGLHLRIEEIALQDQKIQTPGGEVQ